jgi:hypothetical protein
MQLTITISNQTIGDLLVTALEGGINYWCDRATVKRENGQRLSNNEIVDHPDWLPGCEFTFRDADDGIEQTIGFEAFNTALETMVANHPKHFADIINDNHDADTADVLVQLALFGELVYG